MVHEDPRLSWLLCASLFLTDYSPDLCSAIRADKTDEALTTIRLIMEKKECVGAGGQVL